MEFAIIKEIRANNGVKANKRALIALQTVLAVPLWNFSRQCRVSRTPLNRRRLRRPHNDECADGQIVALLRVNRLQNATTSGRRSVLNRSVRLGIRPGSRHVNASDSCCTSLNRRNVFRDDVLTFAKRSRGQPFSFVKRCLKRNDINKRKECRL